MRVRTVLSLAIAILALSVVPARADILIATAGPMTGPFAAFGEQMKRGAKLAVDELNANGGVLGQKVKLVNGNDSCDPKKAVTIAKSMINKGVRFVAGHFCSAASITASDIYHKENVLQISPASTEPMLTERGLGNVYRVSGRDDQQGVIAGNYLADKFS